MRSNGISFGIVYNGNPIYTTGPSWTTDAAEYFVEIEKNQAIIPDDAVLQTWGIQPALVWTP
jgi:hypothetical protein